jgi:hypothetical protein
MGVNEVASDATAASAAGAMNNHRVAKIGIARLIAASRREVIGGIASITTRKLSAMLER